MKLYPIFKAGSYHDGTAVFGESDIAALAESYDPAALKAPLTLDHSKNGQAYGWVKGLKADGAMLFAEFEKVSDELVALVKDGKYGNVSAEIYPAESSDNPKPGKPYVRAVSFLGAWVPEVKGLGAVEFGEDGKALTVFGEDMAVGMADSLTQDDILRQAQDDMKQTNREEENKVNETEELKAKLAESEKSNAELKAASAAKDAEIQKFGESEKAAREELEKLRAEKLAGEHAGKVAGYKAFAEGLANAGQLPPKLTDKVVFLMDALDQMGVKDFAFKVDGTVMKSGDYWSFGEGEESLSPVETFKTVLSEMPKVLEFGEKAKTGAAAVDDATAIDAAAKELVAKEGITYRQAVKRLQGGK